MIHIACNIDSKFMTHCAVTLISLFENNRQSSFFIHIVGPLLTKEDEESLRKVTDSYGNKIQFYRPAEDMIKDFYIKEAKGRISMAAYYRCMLSAILPKEVEKVLYLDCDIVILDNISELWNTDISKHAVACVEDIGCNEDERYSILHYDKKYCYFNSGVLLINLNIWREMQVDKLCSRYFADYPERIRFNDQDLLNAVLYEHTLYVPLKWNMQDGFYRYQMKERSAEEMDKLRQDMLTPIILHYTNRKPWSYDSRHPLKAEYYKYASLLPWKDKSLQRSIDLYILAGIKFLPYALGLRRPKYIKLEE